MRIIDANFTLYASRLRETLGDAQSMIHISTDLWTSPHRHGMLAGYQNVDIASVPSNKSYHDKINR
ncbi:hypothetical protein DM02DRAFT_656872 [Periconia macrospinosa]|uniref:HAT C-terminal dimerisation domain-containing protein n=1 Tax=Periconia macrospinosa TaxID=97972 RepID=A0A2V1DL42_9PLEO|nr:hypothetical protein DM02DRAFT_656872 [Periconia macrospinosa]